MTKDELSSDYYPQFCKGAMHVLLANLLPKILDLSRQVTRIGPDDAYVGLLTDQLAGNICSGIVHLRFATRAILENFENSRAINP